jgi:hypothetical protein
VALDDTSDDGEEFVGFDEVLSTSASKSEVDDLEISCFNQSSRAESNTYQKNYKVLQKQMEALQKIMEGGGRKRSEGGKKRYPLSITNHR